MKKMARHCILRRSRIAVFVVACAVALAASAGADSPKAQQFAGIHIKNFGQMDDRFYRGSQPDEADYKDLAALGIKTVIDLRDDPTSYEKRATESLGLRYVNIPMSATHYPGDDQIQQFLKLATDPSTGAFFVHCAGGRHRTGVAGAVYRMTVNGWDYERTYREMKDYDFYTRFGHGAMKDYVQDYWQKIQGGEIQVMSARSAGPQS